MVTEILHFIGYAFGEAGAVPDAALGPLVLRESSYLPKLAKHGIPYQWDADISSVSVNANAEKDLLVRAYSEDLAKLVSARVQALEKFAVIGGDHTCAIGTWSGAYEAMHTQGPLGLIWFDAHMDSHTPETTESGRIHGMPLACLLGYGYPSLTSIGSYQAKLKPEHVCLIGVRSYEKGEATLLQNLKVRIFFIDEVKRRGINNVLQEAVEIVTRGTAAFGVSLDFDSIEPQDFPAVGVPEKNGLPAEELCKALPIIASHAKFIGADFAEFSPLHDKNHISEQWVMRILESIYGK